MCHLHCIVASFLLLWLGFPAEQPLQQELSVRQEFNNLHNSSETVEHFAKAPEHDAAAVAQDANEDPAHQEIGIIKRSYLRSHASGAHCGIYCVAAAIKSLGGDVSVEELLKTNHVSDRRGCSVDDMIKMIEHKGYKATIVDRISAGSIAFSNTPVIVHLDGQRRVENTHHWICVLGAHDGMPLVFDPPNQPQAIPYGEVMAFTSGLGIAVSKAEQSNSMEIYGKSEIMFWLVVSSLMLFIAIAVSRRFVTTNPSTMIQIATVSCAGLAVVGLQQLIPWSATLRDDTSLAHFREIYAPAMAASEVDHKYVKQHLSDESISLIDARLPDAFGFNGIEGAINWPIDASGIESRVALEKLPPGKPVVVYCESDRCAWSDTVATRLSKRGFKQVFIYRGGIREWTQKVE